jgi:hypothetical protein
MKILVGGLCMRMVCAVVFRELVKLTLFFAAGAALVVGMLQFQ